MPLDIKVINEGTAIFSVPFPQFGGSVEGRYRLVAPRKAMEAFADKIASEMGNEVAPSQAIEFVREQLELFVAEWDLVSGGVPVAPTAEAMRLADIGMEILQPIFTAIAKARETEVPNSSASSPVTASDSGND